MNNTGDIPGGPAIKTLSFWCRGLCSIPGWLCGVAEPKNKERKKINFLEKKMNDIDLIGDCEVIHINYLAEHLV